MEIQRKVSRCRNLLLGVDPESGSFFLRRLPAFAPRVKKCGGSSFTVFLHPTFEGQRLDTKGANDFHLLGISVDVKLTDNHFERGHVIASMEKDGHDTMKVNDLVSFSLIAKVRGDEVNAFVENGKL